MTLDQFQQKYPNLPFTEFHGLMQAIHKSSMSKTRGDPRTASAI